MLVLIKVLMDVYFIYKLSKTFGANCLMNFFQEQDQARKYTLFLIIIFAIAVLLIIIITVFFITGLDVYFDHVPVAVYLSSPLEYVKPKYFYLTSVAVVGVVILGSLYKYQQLSGGGRERVALCRS